MSTQDGVFVAGARDIKSVLENKNAARYEINGLIRYVSIPDPPPEVIVVTDAPGWKTELRLVGRARVMTGCIYEYSPGKETGNG